MTVMNAYCFLNSATSKDILTIFSGLLTPLLAIIATHIAYQQWRTNQIKLQHELYDRRFALYLALMEFLAGIFSESKASDVKMAEFLKRTREGYFLFGKDVSSFLDEVWNKAVDLNCLHTKLYFASLPSGEERDRLAKEQAEIQKWFNQQTRLAPEKFVKYLKLY